MAKNPESRIAWKSKKTGATGNGMFGVLTKRHCFDEVDNLNKKWPELHHWVEEKYNGVTVTVVR